MIKIVKGDLLSVKHGIIGHQVNARGVMGSGVAKQIKDKYPVVFDRYKEFVDEHVYSEDLRHTLLGEIQGIPVHSGLYVINMFGQLNYGNDGKQYTNTEALFNCFQKIRKIAEENDLPVALPYYIGCYRGGADWKVVEDYLITAFNGYEATLYKL